jgi:hypothetical protein
MTGVPQQAFLLTLTKFNPPTSSLCNTSGKNETGVAEICNAGPVTFSICGSRRVLRVPLSPHQPAYF